jgi:hypothetical protein
LSPIDVQAESIKLTILTAAENVVVADDIAVNETVA